MKKGILLMIACAILTAANAQESGTTLVFDKLTHDFGNIVRGDGPQTYSFEFTNRGNVPVSIQKVTASCGCTTSGWTQEPVAPGAKGFVKVTYSPSGITTFNKSVTVKITGGTPETVALRVQGNVVASQAK